MRDKLKQLQAKFRQSLPAKIFAGLVAFYFLFGYFAVNPLAQKLVPWIAEEKLASKASVGKVAFDPLRLKATIENFKLTEKSGAPLASVEKLVVDLEASGLFNWAWKLKEINVVAPQANIAVSRQGKLNWADLISKLNEDPTPPDDSLPRVVIDHIAVSRGDIAYTDAANRDKPFKVALTPINFELDGFSTLPQDRGDYLIAAKFAEQGGTLKWKGDIGVNPVASKGALVLENVKLAKLLQVIKTDTPPFKAESGDIAARFGYAFSLVNDQPKVKLDKISLTLNQLAGELPQMGKLALQQASLNTDHLVFAMQKAPSLQVQNITLSLDDARFAQNATSQIALKKLGASLPQLAFSAPENAQTQFQGLNVALNDIQLTHDKATLLALPELNMNNISLDMAARQANIAQILLPKGVVTANRDKAGNVDWQQAFASADKPPVTEATSETTETTPAEPFSFAIDDIQLQHWRVAYQDQGFVRPLQVNVADFNLGLTVQAPQGKLAVNKLQGKASGITASSNKTQVASLDKLEIAQTDIAPDAQKIDIQAITLAGLKTAIIKEADKPLNWQTILEPVSGGAPKPAATKTASKKPDWAVSMKKLALANASLHVEDKSNATLVVLDIEQAGIEVKDASLDMARAVPVKAAFKVKQGGSFDAHGKLAPQPLKGDLDVKLAGFALTPFAPYINQFAILKLNDGAANIAGKLDLKPDNAVTFNGGFSVDKLALVEEANGAPFMAWEKLGSDSLELSLSPNRLHMSALNIVKPVGKFIINEDKSMNIMRILRKQPAAAPEQTNEKASDTKPEETKETKQEAPTENGTAKPTQAFGAPASSAEPEKPVDMTPPPPTDNAPEAFPVSIETVRIDNAALEFADLSLTPQFGTHIHSLTGVINGVSTNASSTAQVELDGKVDEYGAARIRGALQPFQATNFTNLKLAFTNLEMNRLTPYSGKFAGRKIESGKLSVDLEYRIKQRMLAGENKFVINKLQLGEKVDSKDAANLPLDLAIAILEDSDGVIDLDLPISGNLDDPKFSYGSIVWKAIRNVLTKIVTAPFRALGKLFGGSGDKLEAISFEPGSAALAPPEMEKLKAVSIALSKRHRLALGIVPGYDTAPDARAIQETTLRKRVAEEMGIKLAEGQQPGPIDLTNPKVQKAIDTLYDDLTQKGLLKRLASKLEKPKPGHFEEAQEKLTVSIEIKEADLQALAKARGEAIQKALTDTGIAQERVRVDAPVKTGIQGKLVNTKLTLDVKAAKRVPDAPAAEKTPPAPSPAASPAQ